MRKNSFIFLCGMVLAVYLFAPAQLARAQDSGITSSSDLQLQISTLPEAKLIFTQSFSFPFLAGPGPLVSGNNIKTSLSAEVSPVSLNGVGEIIWTPIAFIELGGGGRLGSGWNMALGNGMGLNVPIGAYDPDTPRKREIDGDPLDGLVWSAWAGGAFQFDLAAVVPGDWNHIIFRAYDEARYAAYTRAGKHDPWIWEADDGENMNGWTWYCSLVLGYQMPRSPVLDFFGFMAEGERLLYNTPNGSFWGQDIGNWTFSGLYNFTITPRFGTTVILQMRTRRNHGTDDLNNKNNLYYQDLELSKENGPRRLVFYRAAFMLNYKIR